MNIEKYKSYC